MAGCVRIPTTRFGVLEVPEEKLIDFPWGLVGFPAAQRFFIIDSPDGPFCWFQAVDIPELAFVVTEPPHFFDDYRVPMPDEVLDALKVDDADETLILLVLTVHRDPGAITANLQGPLVINSQKRCGRQLVLQVPGYTTRHPIVVLDSGVDTTRVSETTPQLEEESC